MSKTQERHAQEERELLEELARRHENGKTFARARMTSVQKRAAVRLVAKGEIVAREASNMQHRIFYALPHKPATA